MDLYLSQSVKNYLSLALLGIVFFLLISFALVSGQKLAQSQLIVVNTQEVKKALDFFYSDNDRYPSADEFSQESVMLNYLNMYPEFNFSNNVCTNKLSYKRPTEQKYELDFCLPAAQNGFLKGWNKFQN